MKTLVDIVVADSGPLIALARLELLALPSQLFNRALVTPIVLAECKAKPGQAEGNLIEAALQSGHLQLAEAPAADPDWTIDEGEASSIALAVANQYAVLIDDKAGRNLARHLECPVLGTAGLLLQAKRKGHIQRVLPLLNSLTASGYYLGEALIRDIVRMANE